MRFAALPAAALACCTCFACSSSSPTTSATMTMTMKPPTSVCSIPQPTPPDTRLHADGMHLRDGLDRIVLLRGVDAGGRSKFAPNLPFDYAASGFDASLAAYMKRAQSWGIDAMRVPFVWAAVEPAQGADDEAFLGRYDALLDAAWAHGIWTIVDLHQDVYAESYCGDGFPAWTIPGQPPAPAHDCPDWELEYFDDADVRSAFDRFWEKGSTVQASFASMWGRMVARYKDKPGVIGFEVINEPAAGTADPTTFEATTLTAFYGAMVAQMRAAAPSSLVFIDPLGEDGVAVQTSLARPPGDGVVFAPHFYPIVHDPTTVESAMKGWVTVGKSWDVPVFIGEFGASRDLASTLPFLIAHFDAFDALGIGGAEWEYSVAAEEWNSETNSIVAADGTEYPVAAAILRPFARAVAADAFTTSFDTTSQTFELAFTPTSGVTEVSLPARVYPKGFDVHVTGACYDESHAGELLLQPDPGAHSVTLKVTPK